MYSSPSTKFRSYIISDATQIKTPSSRGMCSSNTPQQKHHTDPQHRSSMLLMLGLLPFIHCTATSCTFAHDTATVTATSILHLPIKMLHHVSRSTATANCYIATQSLRSTQLKIHPKVDMLVSLESGCLVMLKLPLLLIYADPLLLLRCYNLLSASHTVATSTTQLQTLALQLCYCCSIIPRTN